MTTKMKSPNNNTQPVNRIHEPQSEIKSKVLPLQSFESSNKVEVESSKDKSADIWNVMGFITAGITLCGAAIFYLIGWAYTSNWYSYFGVSISQINLPPQHILVNSTSVILETVIFIIAIIIDQIISWMIAGHQSLSRHLNIAGDSHPTRKGTIFGFNFIGVLIIFLVQQVFLFGYYTQNLYRINRITGLSLLPEELFWFVLVVLISNIYILNYKTIRKSKYSSLICGTIIIFNILFSSVPLAAFGGISDASHGKQGAWTIPTVIISSKDPIPLLLTYSGGDMTESNWYGPLGLVAVNEHSIYLVPWPEGGEEYFLDIRLFIIQRNEQIGLYIYSPGS